MRHRRTLSVLSLLVTLFAYLIFVHQTFTGRAPLFGLRMPPIYPLAILSALGLFGWAVLSWPRRAPVAAAALAMTVFLANDRRIMSGDTAGTALIPHLIVRHGTLEMSSVAPPPPLPYWIFEHGGRLWPRYPITAGVLALPVYLPAILGNVPLDTPSVYPPLEKISASLMAAISVAFVLATLLRLGVSRNLAFGITALYALASPVLSVASQALWQHTPAILAISAALWAAVRSREEVQFSAWAGFASGMAVIARPTAVLVAFALFVWTLSRGRGRAIRFALAAIPPMAAIAVYHTVAFGAPWATGYGSEASAFTSNPWVGLVGVLFSPTRGLVTFSPWVVFAFAGLLLGAKRDLFYTSLGLATLATISLYSVWWAWWGGWTYGPRMLTETLPMLAIGLAPLAAFPRRLVTVALVVTGLLGATLHGIGAFGVKSRLARSTYDVADGTQAMEWARFPLTVLFRGQKSE